MTARYDAAGRITQINLQDTAAIHRFEYDTLGRLRFATDPDIGDRDPDLRRPKLPRPEHERRRPVRSTSTTTSRAGSPGAARRPLTIPCGLRVRLRRRAAALGPGCRVTSRLASRARAGRRGPLLLRRARRARSAWAGRSRPATRPRPAAVREQPEPVGPAAAARQFDDGFANGYQHDGAGATIRQLRRHGRLWTADSIDAAGRVVTEHYGNGATQAYEYDALGLPKHIKVDRPCGAGHALRRVVVTRNDYGAPTIVTDQDGQRAGPQRDVRLRPGGRLTDATLGSRRPAVSVHIPLRHAPEHDPADGVTGPAGHRRSRRQLPLRRARLRAAPADVGRAREGRHDDVARPPAWHSSRCSGWQERKRAPRSEIGGRGRRRRRRLSHARGAVAAVRGPRRGQAGFDPVAGGLRPRFADGRTRLGARGAAGAGDGVVSHRGCGERARRRGHAQRRARRRRGGPRRGAGLSEARTPPARRCFHRPSRRAPRTSSTSSARPAAEEVAYRLQLGNGVAGLRLVSGTLEMFDAGGAPRLRVEPPYIVGADGARTEATLAVGGCAVDTEPGRALGPSGDRPRRGRPARCGSAGATRSVAYPPMLDPRWTTHRQRWPRRARTSGDAARRRARCWSAAGAASTSSTTGLATAELFDPTTSTWAATGSLTGTTPGRWSHSATQLNTGSNATPAARCWSPAGSTARPASTRRSSTSVGHRGGDLGGRREPERRPPPAYGDAARRTATCWSRAG